VRLSAGRNGLKALEQHPFQPLGTPIEIDLESFARVGLDVIVVSVPPHRPLGATEMGGHGVVAPTHQDPIDSVRPIPPGKTRGALCLTLRLNRNGLADELHNPRPFDRIELPSPYAKTGRWKNGDR